MAKDYDMIPGNELPIGLRDAALRSYTHRYTGEHIPAWTRKAAPNGNFYAPQYQNDAEWMAKTLFPVENKGGALQLASGKDVHCQSNNPSWPWGQWLDAPFKKGTPMLSVAMPSLGV